MARKRKQKNKQKVSEGNPLKSDINIVNLSQNTRKYRLIYGTKDD